jgi:predicted ATPase
LKTILKEIDPFAFEEALRLNASQKKIYAVKQDEEDRKNLDKRWDKLNQKLKSSDSQFQEPDCKNLNLRCRPLQVEPVDQGLQRAIHEDLRQGKVHEPVRRRQPQGQSLFHLFF